MRAFLPLLFLLAGLLAGCSGDDPAPPSGGDGDAALTEPSPWGNGDRVVLYENDPGQRLVAVQTCTDPTSTEPIALERNSELVPPGTGSIAVAVTNDDKVVGFQVGSRIDGGPIAWLDPVLDGRGEFTVPVDASQIEDESTGQRWSFVYRYTLAGQGRDCYTGPVLASHPMLFEAVRAPMG